MLKLLHLLVQFMHQIVGFLHIHEPFFCQDNRNLNLTLSKLIFCAAQANIKTYIWYFSWFVKGLCAFDIANGPRIDSSRLILDP